MNLPANHFNSKQRVADHGEVFTPEWIVEAMLDLVKDETDRIDSRFLEPACGSGNFLVSVLRRKLATVEFKYGKSDFERQHYALLALMCIYGIELLADNIVECRTHMLEILADYLKLEESDEIYLAGAYVLSQNLVHGDARKMRTREGQPITFAEWGYLGKGKFQRRDFLLDNLTQSSSISKVDLFSIKNHKHASLTPTDTRYRPMTVRALAALTQEAVL
ncbi:N-6 DNA methylase [Chloroflexota bacterium]